MNQEVVVLVGVKIADPRPIYVKRVYTKRGQRPRDCPFSPSCNNNDFVGQTLFYKLWTLCFLVITTNRDNTKTVRKVQMNFSSMPSKAIHGRTCPIISIILHWLKPGEKFVRYTHVPKEKKIVLNNDPFRDMSTSPGFGKSITGKTSNNVFSVDNRKQLYKEQCDQCGSFLNDDGQYFYLNMDLFEKSDFKKKFDRFEAVLEKMVEEKKVQETKDKVQKAINKVQEAKDRVQEAKNRIQELRNSVEERDTANASDQDQEQGKEEYGSKVILQRSEEAWMVGLS